MRIIYFILFILLSMPCFGISRLNCLFSQLAKSDVGIQLNKNKAIQFYGKDFESPEDLLKFAKEETQKGNNYFLEMAKKEIDAYQKLPIGKSRWLTTDPDIPRSVGGGWFRRKVNDVFRKIPFFKDGEAVSRFPLKYALDGTIDVAEYIMSSSRGFLNLEDQIQSNAIISFFKSTKGIDDDILVSEDLIKQITTFSKKFDDLSIDELPVPLELKLGQDYYSSFSKDKKEEILKAFHREKVLNGRDIEGLNSKELSDLNLNVNNLVKDSISLKVNEFNPELSKRVTSIGLDELYKDRKSGFWKARPIDETGQAYGDSSSAVLVKEHLQEKFFKQFYSWFDENKDLFTRKFALDLEGLDEGLKHSELMLIFAKNFEEGKINNIQIPPWLKESQNSDFLTKTIKLHIDNKNLADIEKIADSWKLSLKDFDKNLTEKVATVRILEARLKILEGAASDFKKGIKPKFINLPSTQNIKEFTPSKVSSSSLAEVRDAIDADRQRLLKLITPGNPKSIDSLLKNTHLNRSRLEILGAMAKSNERFEEHRKIVDFLVSTPLPKRGRVASIRSEKNAALKSIFWSQERDEFAESTRKILQEAGANRHDATATINFERLKKGGAFSLAITGVGLYFKIKVAQKKLNDGLENSKDLFSHCLFEQLPDQFSEEVFRASFNQCFEEHHPNYLILKKLYANAKDIKIGNETIHLDNKEEVKKLREQIEEETKKLMDFSRENYLLEIQGKNKAKNFLDNIGNNKEIPKTDLVLEEDQ